MMNVLKLVSYLSTNLHTTRTSSKSVSLFLHLYGVRLSACLNVSEASERMYSTHKLESIDYGC